MNLPRRWLPNVWLIAFLWRQQLAVTGVAMVLAACFAVLWPGRLYWPVMEEAGLLVMLFVVVHSIALVMVQGRPSSGTFAYLYTRGFSRDRLWAHQMLASAAAVLTVALAFVLVTWTPARATYQDLVRLSPFYPGAAMLERGFLLRPLLVYTLMLPSLHYVWIRLAQPMRGGLAGFWLAAWLIAASVIALGNELFEGPTLAWHSWLTLASLAMAAGLLAIWGWRLHRQVEVTR
ncbi:MAG: hypothetical protein WDZ31_04905 [Phycisphaeraceae bacterium]